MDTERQVIKKDNFSFSWKQLSRRDNGLRDLELEIQAGPGLAPVIHVPHVLFHLGQLEVEVHDSHPIVKDEAIVGGIFGSAQDLQNHPALCDHEWKTEQPLRVCIGHVGRDYVLHEVVESFGAAAVELFSKMPRSTQLVAPATATAQQLAEPAKGIYLTAAEAAKWVGISARRLTERMKKAAEEDGVYGPDMEHRAMFHLTPKTHEAFPPGTMTVAVSAVRRSGKWGVALLPMVTAEI